MKFSNAYRGISKILTAQWISLISTLLMIVGVIVAAVNTVALVEVAEASAQAASGALVGAGIGSVLALIGLIIGVIAIILNLVGLGTARKDENKFNTAFILCIVSLIAGIAASATQVAAPPVSSWLSLAQKITSLAVIEYAVAGIVVLADKLQNAQVAKLGRNLRVIILIIYCVVAALIVVGNLSKLGSIFSIIELVLEVIVFIVYIVLLAKAKKMLA